MSRIAILVIPIVLLGGCVTSATSIVDDMYAHGCRMTSFTYNLKYGSGEVQCAVGTHAQNPL